MSSGRTTTQTLILVNVTFPLGLPPLYTYLAFADGSKADSVSLGPGDQVAWFVRVQAGSGWIRPAYTLIFEDCSILGTSSIEVPKGGSSGFFTVQAVSGETKYTLAVSGVLPVSDPHIIIDPNGAQAVLAVGPQHNIRWTAATNVMEVSDGVHPYAPFPPAGLPIAAGDKVQFFAVLTPPADFQIDFPSDLNANNIWESPFYVNQSMFPTISHGANENTDNLTVADRSDGAGTHFRFVAVLTDGSEHSPAYALVFPAPGHRKS